MSHWSRCRVCSWCHLRLANGNENWGWYALAGAGGVAGLGALGGAIYKAALMKFLVLEELLKILGTRSEHILFLKILSCLIILIVQQS